MLVTVVRRLAAVVAVFGVVFAPGAMDAPSAAEPVETAPADLSAVVLAPTFTSSELTLGRTEEAVADEQCAAAAWLSSDTVCAAGAGFVTRANAPMTEVAVPAERKEGTWSERGPPTS